MLISRVNGAIVPEHYISAGLSDQSENKDVPTEEKRPHLKSETLPTGPKLYRQNKTPTRRGYLGEQERPLT